MNGQGSTVVEVMERAKQAAWDALWRHIAKRGDLATRDQLWADYDLAALTLRAELRKRAQLTRVAA